MNQKNCKNCNNSFPLAPDDLTFYAKMDVPAPTLCPRCRMQRRMLFYNDRSLYKRTCGLCNKEVISGHRPDSKHPVYCQPCWWSDKWDPTEFGRDYDPSRSFFDQWKDLRDAVPLPSLSNIYASNTNSEYCNMTSYLKNCYLLFTSDFDEECAYSAYLEKSRRCYDVDHGMECELCYNSIGLYKCYRVMNSSNVTESMDISYSRDLRNCSHCFGCINLRGKQYCIFNEQKTKEQYFEEIKKYSRADAEKFFQTQPRKYMIGIGNTNVSGDHIFWSKNVRESYEIVGGEDMKYCQFFIIGGSKNCMDVTMWGSNLMQAYECCAVGNNQNNIKFTMECWNEASNLTFCKYILSPCSDLFGCIGLRNKKYCILNKQYSPEEYEKLKCLVIQHMKDNGTYGEFFPPELSLYGYNETLAQEYLPLTKEEALAQGFKWNEPEKREYKIGGDVIACEHCTRAFRLIESEKEFYAQMQIPVPKLCPNCRHYERLKLRNGVELYDRICMKCGAEFKTSYSPDRPEIVYCELCYNAEIL